MIQNIERSTDVNARLGHEVVSSLENTLEWMRSQFDAFRADVKIEKTATPPHVATAASSLQ